MHHSQGRHRLVLPQISPHHSQTDPAKIIHASFTRHVFLITYKSRDSSHWLCNMHSLNMANSKCCEEVLFVIVVVNLLEYLATCCDFRQLQSLLRNKVSFTCFSSSEGRCVEVTRTSEAGVGVEGPAGRRSGGNCAPPPVTRDCWKKETMN